MILVTGCAGFIGFHLCQYLTGNGLKVLGIDNLNNYYSPKLKEARLEILNQSKNFSFQKIDICDQPALEQLKTQRIEVIIHLAAQPGVRYSLENPHAYTKNNVDGHLNILEFSKQLSHLKKLIYASSSSIYGNNEKIPFSVDDITDNPASVYAATKKACELLSQTYYNLYQIPMVGLRFFTVYGPWGRPDMSPYKFTEAIFAGRPIDVYNHGQMKRDFTFIDDIIAGIYATIHLKHKDHRIYNLGNHHTVELMEFIHTLEKAIGKPAQLNMLPMQPGEVLMTYADITKSEDDLNFSPKTSIAEGLPKFVGWFKKYHNI